MKLYILALISFISGPALAYGYEYDDSGYAVGFDSLSPLTIDKLYSTLNSMDHQTIEGLLPLLKAQDPDMFTNYVMMYGSRSLQGSSMEAPRVLLSTKGAELVVTFNGHEGQKGFNDLEIMFFDRATNRFNFQEISFRNGKATPSAVNPAKCLACHQSPNRAGVDPRPNWEAYNVWPGAFNSVAHSADVIRPGHEKFNPFLLDQLKKEEGATATFFKDIQPKHPRYQFLEPYSVFKPYGKEVYYDGPSVGRSANRMPVFFTHSTGDLNARRLARMIRDDYPEIYQNYKYAILSAARCFQVPLPQTLIQWHQSALRSQGLQVPKVNDKLAVNTMQEGMLLIFGAFGIDISDWSTDFNTNGQFAFTEKFGQPTGTGVSNVVYARAFESVWGIDYDGDMKDSCDELRQKSLASATAPKSSFSLLPEFSELAQANAEPLLNRCIECHVTYAIAPFIPFHDESSLNTALSKNGGQLYREILYRLGPLPGFQDAMPPQGYVSQDKKEEVISYIQRLYTSSRR